MCIEIEIVLISNKVNIPGIDFISIQSKDDKPLSQKKHQNHCPNLYLNHVYLVIQKLL
jgi:hypothetical protein